MRAKDKYTVFSRTDPGYRKSLHKVSSLVCAWLRDGPALMCWQTLPGAQMDQVDDTGEPSRILAPGVKRVYEYSNAFPRP